MASTGDEEPGLEIIVSDEPRVVLYAERLRDGRVALGTRRRREGGWEPGELYLLEPSAYLDLAAWFAPLVSAAWIDAIRDRQPEPLRTAEELFGEGAEGVTRLAGDMLEQIPHALLARAMILLANSIGPEARNRLVQQLNRTTNPSDDSMLRRRMADESEAFAYAVATAALFDALATGLVDGGGEEG
ncbi:MAG: hypothetical protein KY464_12120 [Gemmatimonadetes bacterium]|nr:hypothetical protein [Gemmatimonadota bacterium]